MATKLKQFSKFNFRPEGFQYPIGLSFGTTGTTTILTDNVATNTTGGTRTVDVTNNFTVHTFTESGTFDPGFSGTVEYLVVAGGGSGAMLFGAGGAGGVQQGFIEVESTETYNVTVGGGGSAPARGSGGGGAGTGANGTNSSFATISATGGGGGVADGNGFSGGSGGGGGQWNNTRRYAGEAQSTAKFPREGFPGGETPFVQHTSGGGGG